MRASKRRPRGIPVMTLFAAGIGTSACLGIADTEPSASDAGSDASQGLDGGGFPGTDSGTGGTGGSAGSTSGGGGSPSGGGGSPSGGGGSPSGGGGSPSGGGGTTNTGGSSGGTLTIFPPSGLNGDGFLANPDLCGKQVWDSYQQSSYKAIHAGRDVPCGGIATYRAFMRFDLSPASGKSIKSAHLRFNYVSKADNPTVNVRLFRIADFGQLDANDWNATEIENYGIVFGGSTGPGWIDVDVTAAAQAAAGGVIAFKLQAGDEGFNPNGQSHWYGIAATENGQSTSPRIVVTY